VGKPERSRLYTNVSIETYLAEERLSNRFQPTADVCAVLHAQFNPIAPENTRSRLEITANETFRTANAIFSAVGWKRSVAYAFSATYRLSLLHRWNFISSRLRENVKISPGYSETDT
jgi:hypothetical protein